MKTKKLFIATITLFFLIGGVGCKEEVQEIINPPYIENSGTLLGTWYWEKSYVGGELNASNPQTPQNTGVIKSLIFNKDSSWILKEHDNIIKGERFTVGRGLYIPNMTEYDSICYYQDKQIIKIDYYKLYGNTLDFCFGFRGGATGGVIRWKYISEN